MKKNIEEIFDLCLEDLKKGLSQEECLAKYKDYREELEPLLKIVLNIESLPKPEPSPDALYTTLLRIGQCVSEKRIWPKWNLDWLFSPRYVLTKAIAIILIFSLIFWSVGIASTQALPGDLLYPFKLVTERVNFILTIDPEGKAELRLNFSERRLKELLSRYRKEGVIDKELISAMLDEAKLALDNISYLPKEKQPLFYSKVNYFNTYQKETLQSIQPYVQDTQKPYIDRAIEVCSKRHEWMQKMMKQGMYCPWNESHHCGRR